MHYYRGYQLCSHSIVFQHFMKPEGSLPHSQELFTCPSPETDQSSTHHPHPISPRSIGMLCTHLCLSLPSGLFPLWLSYQQPIHVPFHSHLYAPPSNLHDLVILIMLNEEYKSRSSLQRSFLCLPVTSSVFGPNIIISTLFSNILSLCSSPNVRDQVS
jgi:hypothetical protein